MTPNDSRDMKDQPPEYLQGNVDAWQKRAEEYARNAGDSWATDHPSWGIWGIPESDVGLLPVDMY